MQLESFVISKLLKPIDPRIEASFAPLSPDVIAYNRSDFVSRYRNFTAFRWSGQEYVPSGESDERFNQRRAFHVQYQSSRPLPIDSTLIEAGVIQALLVEVTNALPVTRGDYDIGVNQIRVVANDDYMGSPAPSLHQDGYDYSCHLNISQHNVSGGTSLIGTSKAAQDLVLEYTLQPGEFVFFNDRTMYHTATPVCCKIGGEPTWRDMVILDFVHV
jgi:hypothetical protein